MSEMDGSVFYVNKTKFVNRSTSNPLRRFAASRRVRSQGRSTDRFTSLAAFAAPLPRGARTPDVTIVTGVI